MVEARCQPGAYESRPGLEAPLYPKSVLAVQHILFSRHYPLACYHNQFELILYAQPRIIACRISENLAKSNIVK